MKSVDKIYVNTLKLPDNSSDSSTLGSALKMLEIILHVCWLFLSY